MPIKFYTYMCTYALLCLKKIFVRILMIGHCAEEFQVIFTSFLALSYIEFFFFFTNNHVIP